MRRRKINNRYLSDKIPEQISRDSIDVEEFAEALKKFADEYLHGALEVNITGRIAGYASISLEMTAYMLRTALKNARDDEVISVSISLEKSITLNIEYEYEAHEEAIASVIGIAKVAGFMAQRHGNIITLKSNVTDSSIVKIYAMSKEKIANHLHEIFFL